MSDNQSLPEAWQWRQMLPCDIEGALDIEQRVSPDPWRRFAFEQSIESHSAQVLVAHPQQLQGFLLWSVTADQAELLNIAVHPNQQAKGYGRLLLDHLISQLPSAVASLFLEVRASNFAAIGLYQNYGFNQIGERRGYYRASSDPLTGREDALVMALELLN
ncbi:ribosomal protein S18-alanine N-acetyltransferase [Porticoccaceae bacterium]|nr:ribosomal protein S18-alanine N-acetyltransferase [Porticoccaceae bacterium]